MKKQIVLSLIIITLLGLFGVKALFHQGYFTSHDGWHQVVRLFYYDKSIRDGVFPPNYVNYLYDGYGYPLFIFSYHLPWMIAEPFMLAGVSVFDSIKAVYIIGFVLSGMTMFFFLKNRFGVLESLGGSLVYMWAPYHFSNIFVRGAIGENTVFIFIPLYFLAIDKLKEKFRWSALTIGSVALAGLILSHAIVSFIVIGSSFIYLFFQMLFSVKKIKPYLVKIGLLFLTGLLLSAYYLIPSIVLKKDTVFNEKILATKNEGRFVSLYDLLYSKWGFGFATPRGPDSMSFQVGIVQWIVVIFLIVFLFLSFKKINKIPQRDFFWGLTSIFIIALFLITPNSVFFWNFIEKTLFNIDFPWRFLTIAVFAASALASYFLFILPKKFKFPLFLFLIVVAFYTNRNHLRVNQYTDVPIELYLLSERTTNTYDEYLPQGVNNKKLEEEKKGGQIEASSTVKITNLDRKVNSLAYNYSSSVSGTMLVNQLYFPGWRAFSDNKEVNLKKDQDGLIIVPLFEGEHRVLVSFLGGKEIFIGKLLSLLTAATLFFGFFIKSPKPKKGII